MIHKQNGKKNKTTSIILFDVDQTILKEDSFQFLMKKILGKAPWRILLFPLGICFSPGGRGKGDLRTRVKSAVLWMLTFGKRRAQEEICSLVKEIAWFQEAVDIIQKKQQEGHNILLVSASLEFWLAPLFQDLPCEFIGSLGQKKGGGFLLKGRNCWGKEKVLRIKSFLGSQFHEVKFLEAYSDSLVDQPFMSLAEKPFWINRSHQWGNSLFWEKTCGFKEAQNSLKEIK